MLRHPMFDLHLECLRSYCPSLSVMQTLSCDTEGEHYAASPCSATAYMTLPQYIVVFYRRPVLPLLSWSL